MRIAQLISRNSRSFASLPATAPSLFLSTSPRHLSSVSFLRLIRAVLFRATFAPSHLRAASGARRERDRERVRERESQSVERGEYYSKQDLHFYDAAISYQRHQPERIGITFIYVYIYKYKCVCVFVFVCLCVCVCVFVSLWVCGFVGLWVCGFVGLWVHSTFEFYGKGRIISK